MNNGSKSMGQRVSKEAFGRGRRKKGTSLEASLSAHRSATAAATAVATAVATDSEYMPRLSTIVEVRPSTVGSFLKKSREKKGMSLKMISHKTKIGVTLLEFLEADRLNQLPNKTYVVGFVKSYADALDLNQGECLNYLNDTYQKLMPESQEEEGPEEGLSFWFSFSSQTVMILCLFLATTLIGGSIYLFVNWEKLGEKRGEALAGGSTSPAQISPQTADSEASPKQAEDVLIIGADYLKSFEQKVMMSPPSLKESSSLAQKSTIPNVIFRDGFQDYFSLVEQKSLISPLGDQKLLDKVNFRPMPATALYRVLYHDPDNEIEKYLPKEVQGSVAQGQQNVFISAISGDTWLTYKSDDERVKQILLKKGGRLLVRGREIRLFMGNVHITKIFLNNFPLKIYSKTGVKSLIFPEKSKSKYFLPLFIFKKDGTVITSDQVKAPSLPR